MRNNSGYPRVIVAGVLAWQGLVGPRCMARVPDVLSEVINTTNATGGAALNNPALGSFAYDPINNRIFTISFGANAQLRCIDNIDGEQTATPMVSPTQWMLFTRDGDPGRKYGQYTVFGMLMNPRPIEALGLGAYQAAWLVDSAKVVEDPTAPKGTPRPDLTQRIYRYNLQPVADGKDGRHVFTPLLTEAGISAAAGIGGASNIGRQFAWSTDGQSIYLNDSQKDFGGIWKVNVSTGAATWLYQNTSTDRINTELAVMPSAAGDKILFRGTSLSGNKGGIDCLTVDGAKAAGPSEFISAAALADFLETKESLPEVTAIAADAAGNTYFSDFTTKNLIRRDPAGRFIKLVSRAERELFFGKTTNNQVLRMQPRTVAYQNEAGQAFDVTQILYAESSPISVVGGVYVFKPGDFNRDDAVNGADMDLFKSALALRSLPAEVSAQADYLRFDLNGNGAVNFKDVRILQGFCGFADADANFDGRVDFGDLLAMSTSYQTGTRLWTEGDFTGEGQVDLVDLNVLAANWSLPRPGLDEIDQYGFPGAFRNDVIAVLVPEPSVLGLGAAALLLLLGRSRKRIAG